MKRLPIFLGTMAWLLLTCDPHAAPASTSFEDRLTRDWWGTRAMLAKRGLTLDLEYSHFYQGLWSGQGDHDWRFGGRVDSFFNVDTGKLGLWEGGGIRTHVEYRYNRLPASLGGALLPMNTASLLPLSSPDELVLSSLYFTQQIGSKASIMLGRINTPDLLANDLFFGGWGTRRFQNVAFVAPVSGVTPPVIYGGILNIKTAPLTWTLMVYDPEDWTAKFWPDTLFSTGVNFSLGVTWAGKLANRTTTVNLTGAYSTRDGADLGQLLLPSNLRTSNKDGSYHISLSFSHLLYERREQPGQGWGIFMKAATADGNPNPIRRSIITGLGGLGIIPGRERDSFGVGFFYYDFSDALQDAVAPLVRFEDEMGLEVYYDYAITPWFHLAADLQVVNPATGANSHAVVGGLRANIRF
jgi:porin